MNLTRWLLLEKSQKGDLTTSTLQTTSTETSTDTSIRRPNADGFSQLHSPASRIRTLNNHLCLRKTTRDLKKQFLTVFWLISHLFICTRGGEEFKKILNECGGAWNIPHWMTTILSGGDEWKLMLLDGHDMESIFPTLVKRSAGDGIETTASTLASRLVASLGLPQNLGDSIRHDVQYCCLSVEYEDDRRLPARQKMWTWLTKSLRGNRATVGPYRLLYRRGEGL